MSQIGYVSRTNNNVELTSKDKEWLESIRNVISPKTKVFLFTKNEKEYYKFSFGNKNIKNWLIKNECKNKKSLTLKMPNVPKQYFRDFIRGVLDGDGSITCSFHKNIKQHNDKISCKYMNCNIVSASKDFIYNLSDVLKDFGFINHNIITYPVPLNKEMFGKTVNTYNDLYKLYIHVKDMYNFIKYVYYEENILCLKRKRANSNEIIKYFEQDHININIKTFIDHQCY